MYSIAYSSFCGEMTTFKIYPQQFSKINFSWVWWCTSCNPSSPSTLEVEAGRLEVQDQSGIHRKTLSQKTNIIVAILYNRSLELIPLAN
jgi:hypothetical protein